MSTYCSDDIFDNFELENINIDYSSIYKPVYTNNNTYNVGVKDNNYQATTPSSAGISVSYYTMSGVGNSRPVLGDITNTYSNRR